MMITSPLRVPGDRLGLPLVGSLEGIFLNWEEGFPALELARHALDQGVACPFGICPQCHGGWLRPPVPEIHSRVYLPEENGGELEDGDGISALQLSAIIFSIALNRSQFPDVRRDWDQWENQHYRGRFHVNGMPPIVVVEGVGWKGGGKTGPETGPEGRTAADTAALESGAVLLCENGVLCNMEINRYDIRT